MTDFTPIPADFQAFCDANDHQILNDYENESSGFHWTTTFDGNFQRDVFTADDDGLFFEGTQIGTGPTVHGMVDVASIEYEHSVLHFEVTHQETDEVHSCTIASVEGADGYMLQEYVDE